MGIYTYTISDKTLQKVSGRVEALSLEEAASAIKRNGWFIISLKPAGETKSFFLSIFSKQTFTSLELILFTDHLASMIGSGTPLVEALETYGEDDNKHQSQFIGEITSNVSQGKKFSEVLRTIPKVFSSYYASLVAAGELSGRLDETFKHLAAKLRREYEFKERIKSALIYPSLVLSAALLVILLLIFLVIPKITELTKSFGGDLPLATRIVAGASTFLTNYGPLVIGVFILFCIGLVLTLRNPKTKRIIDPYLLKLPGIGKILRFYILSQILRLIGSCLSYGIPLTKTIDAVEDVVGNRVYKDACKRFKNRIVHGMDLSTALALEGKFLFPSFIIRSTRGAEKTGHVDVALLRLSVFFENSVDRALKRMTELIEPVLTIILGVIVGAIALAVIGPIYQLTSKIR